MNIIDMHCHILPGLDDGAQSLEEAVRALQEAKKQGIDQVILTPHHYPDSDMPIELIFQTMKQLEDAIQENEIGIKLYPGHGCLYYTDLPEKLDKQEVLTLAGSRYVLVEFLENVHYREILYGMRQLKEAGYIPILAHYERYRTLMQKGKVAKLKDEGFLLQLNFDTVQRQYGLLKKNPYLGDLKKGYVDFMSSDCHGMKYRKYFIEPSVDWMLQNLSAEKTKEILVDNPSKIINHIY